LQHILDDFRLTRPHIPFLNTFFEFRVETADVKQLTLQDSLLEKHFQSALMAEAIFDFEVVFTYNQESESGKLLYTFSASSDLFLEITLNKITRRFQQFCSQLFTMDSSTNRTNKSLIPVKKLSIVLPEEAEEMQGVVFHRLSNVDDEGMFISLYSLC